MSHEPESSTVTDPTNNANASESSNNVGTRRTHDTVARERRQRNRRLFNKKREAFLGDLMRNVDILVYAELSAVYYMEYVFST